MVKSKAAGLRLNLGAWWDDGYIGLKFVNIPEVLPVAIPQAGRWEDLNLCFAPIRHEDLDDIFKSLMSFRLPRLHTLKITFSRSSGNGRHPSLHFYKTWELNNLRTLNITNASAPEAFAAPLLTSLSITNYDGFVDYGKLFDFLSANRALEDILLWFSNCGRFGNPVVGDAVLENVKTFKIFTRYTSIDDLYPLRKALRIPNVEEIELKCIERSFYNEDFNEEHRRDSNKYLEFLLCGDDSYPHLESLTYEHDCSKGNYILPFDKTPNLRSLKLHTSSRCPSVTGLGTLPPLRELRVHLHDSSWLGWMKKLHQHMLEQDKLSGLETLVLHHEDRSIGDIGELFGNRRTVWKGPPE